MPTLLREKGFRFMIYASDRDEPKHVHVMKGDGYGKVWLEPIEIQYLQDFNVQESRDILNIIESNIEMLKLKWDEFFYK